MSQTLTAIIVDDEPLARNLLAVILDDIGGVEVTAQCQNGFEAIDAVMKYKPDVMFLDIEMPEMNGFDVIKSIQSDMLPKVIFTTAYAQYAVEAFRVKALNYVLKPLDDEKIRESIERVKLSYGTGDAKPSKSALLSALDRPDKAHNDRALVVKDSDKFAFLGKSDIDWIEADGDYVCIHLGHKTHLIRATLKSVEAQLSPENFLRIHRSTIINLDKIDEIVPAQKGEAIIITKTGQRLKVSRRYGAILRNKLR